MLQQLYRGLMSLDANLDPVSALAERVDVSPDGLRHEFTLRPDARFHDGRVVIPADNPGNAMVSAAHPVSEQWITDAEMAANPGLIKTMKVKPPMGQGRVRLIRIGDVDLQPCGGTHVANTSEIGPLKLGKIEKKGAQNRRVALLFG